MDFELTNKQREYFGLEPIEDDWDKVPFKGDRYRPNSILYFQGNTIKKQVISTEDKYVECEFDELTRDRTILLPKTSKGREQNLTASTLEKREGNGVYLRVDSHGGFVIGSYTTQTTFYTRWWEEWDALETKNIPEAINEFIEQSPCDQLTKINKFKNAKRKNVRYKSGDYFCFKLNRTLFGFGRILLDIGKIKKKGLISKQHGLGMAMTKPLLVQLFAYTSNKKEIDISILKDAPKLPSDLMMDNLLFYGEYEIIGHKELEEDEFEFPISYGLHIGRMQTVFLQWGFIHKELPMHKYGKYIVGNNPFVDENSPSRKMQNPFGYYGIGFRTHYNTNDILRTIENNGVFDYEASRHFKAKFDLRNPKHKAIREEILKVFGLDPDKSYVENAKLTGTELTTEIVRRVS